ncbi:AAA family ATPase [Streptomyces sp. NBC_00872]|uniref:AAA family ATPase n=1 Tax=Streptomyces sp. NBC_00872 TaxID=2903686 RepID=UPI0038677CF0|nr:MoxR family ATPase [Streptomyces sp. NBC_00872]
MSESTSTSAPTGTESADTKDWWIYQGPGDPAEKCARLAGQLPPWREFEGVRDPEYAPPGDTDPAWAETHRRGAGYVPDTEERDAVNTALYLRRPLLVTGKPGVGKSTLAYSIAADLGLGPVLHWPVTSRSTLRDGLYQYDAIGRLHDANLGHLRASRSSETPVPDHSIAPYLRLGPLGTALLPQEKPRVLLVDEIDKSDIDLPGDLLTVFEEGSFEIPELARVARQEPRVRIGTHDDPDLRVWVEKGRVKCQAFPVVVLTSNGERDFPPPFLRRCIRLHMAPPGKEKLTRIVRRRLGLDPAADDRYGDLVEAFLRRRMDGDLATDQLLNAVQLRLSGAWPDPAERERFLETVLQQLTGTPSA